MSKGVDQQACEHHYKHKQRNLRDFRPAEPAPVQQRTMKQTRPGQWFRAADDCHEDGLKK